MKRISGLAAVTALAGALVLMQGCASVRGEQPRAGSTAEKSFYSEVEHVDAQNRILTLTNTKRAQEAYLVSEKFQDMSQVKPGDRIEAIYDERVVLVVEPPQPTSFGTIDTSEESVRVPVVEQDENRKVIVTTVAASVENVDAAAGTIRVHEPEGDIRTMRVKDPATLSNVKAGDLVSITYTETIDVRVLAENQR